MHVGIVCWFCSLQYEHMSDAHWPFILIDLMKVANFVQLIMLNAARLMLASHATYAHVLTTMVQ